MAKLSGRVIREIIIIIAVIGLLILLAIYLRPSKPYLKNDIHIPPDENQPTGNAKPMGHGPKLLPEDDGTVVASALGHDITLGEINQEANLLFRRYGIDPESEMAKKEILLDQLKVEGLAEILSGSLILEKAPGLGINAKEVVDNAMAEWAQGFDSPEAKLASIPDNQGVTIERMRKMYTRQLLPPLIQSALTKDSGDIAQEEKDKIFAGWLLTGLSELKIEFKDEKSAISWKDYINQLLDNNKSTGESAPTTGEGK